MQGVAQGGEFTRSRAAKRDAGGDALYVGAVFEQFGGVVRFVGNEGGNGVVACADGQVVGQGFGQPAFQEAAAGSACAVVEDAGEAAFVVAGEGVFEFEVAACGGVELQGAALYGAARRCERGQGGFVGVVQVLQQTAKSKESRWFVSRMIPKKFSKHSK